MDVGVKEAISLIVQMGAGCHVVAHHLREGGKPTREQMIEMLNSQKEALESISDFLVGHLDLSDEEIHEIAKHAETAIAARASETEH
jgi:prefoldin subunit 5